MVNSIDGAIAYARSHPTRDGGSWSGWCASFCYRAGGFSQSFVNAMTAGSNSGTLRSDWNYAPRGALHYWAGVGGDGHCAFELGGGLLMMASSAVTDSWGTAVGTVSFPTYALKGIPYRGWSMRWGSETLAGSGTAGGGYTPIEEDMSLTAEQDSMLRNLFAATFYGGPSMEDAGNPIQRSLAQINAGVNSPVQRGDVLTTPRQDNADTNSLVRQIIAEGVKVNGELPDTDLDALVEKVIAEIKKLEYKAS